MQVGDVIHTMSSTADSPEVCFPAILGGQVADHWWVLTILFSGARIAWITDVDWHLKDDCTTDSGRPQKVSEK